MSTLDRVVSRFLSAPVFSVGADASLEDARLRLEQHGVSSLAVFDGPDPLAGVITRKDLLEVGRFEVHDDGVSRLGLPPQSVRWLMSTPVLAVDPESTLRQVASELWRHHVHRAFVARGSHLHGVCSTRDVMRGLIDARVATPVERLMSSPVESIPVDSLLVAAIDRLRSCAVTGLAVIDGHGWPVGMFTQAEALESRSRAPSTTLERAMSARFVAVGPRTAVHHAAAQALATRARHAIVVEGGALLGILSGLDFAHAAA